MDVRSSYWAKGKHTKVYKNTVIPLLTAYSKTVGEQRVLYMEMNNRGTVALGIQSASFVLVVK